MADKFTTDERKLLATLPWLAGAAVSECDKVGGGAAFAKEMEVIRDAVYQWSQYYLLRTKVQLGMEPNAFDFDKAEQEVFPMIQQAMALLESKDTAENIDHYKRFVLSVAHAAAAAYGAGFRGGGPKVSSTETQMLDKLAQALKGPDILQSIVREYEESQTKKK